jgi:transcriptional regulator with XRE-family HTH domain
MDKLLGITILVLRELRGWTQKTLAEKAGISSGSVSNYEQGTSVVDRDALRKIAFAVRLPLADLDRLAAAILAVSRAMEPRAEPIERTDLAARITGELAEDFRAEVFPIVLDALASLGSSRSAVPRAEPPPRRML